MSQSSSRLDQAKEAQDKGGDWYRSPIAMIAGLVIFVGALALLVMALTGGDETASVDAGVDTGAETAVNGDAPSQPPAEEDVVLPGISFGGDGIAEASSVIVEGDALPTFVLGDDDAAVGVAAPVVTASSLANGNPITLGPGRARVVGFFAHWCPHCQAELPELTSWLAENQLPPNTEFIAVSTAVDQSRGNYPPSAWFTEVGWGAPVLVDDANSTLLNTYGFGSFPAFIAIDASGTVVDRAGGNVGSEGFATLFDNFAS